MFSPNTSQANASIYDHKSSFNSLNSRRRARPTHQSQPSITATLTAHPPKKPRQRSVSAQRQLNASPEAQAVVAAAAVDPLALKTYSAAEKKVSVEEWAKNEKYCVSQLVALPMELRDRGGNLYNRVTATTDETTGSALLIKDSGAYVWKYDDAHPLPKPDHFPLPPDEPIGTDGLIPLALGCLVAPVANSDEPGFVAVMPVTGRIAYWDAIGSAIAEGLFTKKRGVEGRVELVTAETVQSICSIEPAGFVLCMSTGRLAHLALRDGTGKPLVIVTTMRNYGAGVSSLFGGIANAFKAGGSKRDVVAVRAGKIINRSEREVIVATSRGHFTQWEINRNGATVIVADVDAREQMLNRVIATGPSDLIARDRELFGVLDIATSYNPHEECLEVLALTSFGSGHGLGQRTYYSLVKILFKGGKHIVQNVYPIACYHEPVDRSFTTQTRVYLPNPSRTAFVVFSKAIIVVSIIPEDKYDQVEEDQRVVGYDPTKGFEDVIQFRKDINVEIIGSGYEDVSENSTIGFGMDFDAANELRRKIYSPSILVVTKGAGVLRVNVFDCEDKEHRPKPSPRPVPVKMKIEQAVYYGDQEKNLLDFDGWTQTNYPIEEIQTAAREISKDILSCRSRYLALGGPSVDAQLTHRSQKIQRLAEHLKVVYKSLSSETKWKLCWDAEKLEGARAIYEGHNERLRTDREHYQEVLKEAVIAQLSDHQELHGDDPIREWFEQHVLYLWELLPYARVAYKNAAQRDDEKLAHRVEEANEIVINGLSTAYQFRIAHADLYGLEEEVNAKGIPISNQPTAPWTSSPDILTMLGRQIEISNKLLKTLTNKPDDEKRSFREKIIDQLVELVETTCRNFVERATWCRNQQNPIMHTEGLDIQERYLKSRNEWITSLDKQDRRENALEIAEKYEDYRTLVELSFQEIFKITLYIEQHANELAGQEAKKQSLQQQRESVHDRIFDYFQKFGKDFAFTLYEYQIEQGNLKDLLQQFAAYKQYLTQFLHSKPQFAKLSWINDVSAGDFQSAGTTLIHAAKEEPDLWCKKIELSIGKLAMLINKSESEIDRITKSFDAQLNLIELQELFYFYLYPELRGAIDAQACVQLAMDVWGTGLEKRHTLCDLFKKGLTKLVSRQAADVLTLIDLLTLKSVDTENYRAESATDWPGEFCVAFQILAYGDLAEEEWAEAERTIWRRCWLRDDWPKILNTAGKTDQELEDATDLTSVFELMKFGLVKGLFNQGLPFSPLLPQHTLFSQTTESLHIRFPNLSPSSLLDLQAELRQENVQIQDMVKRAKIDPWFESLWRSAKEWHEQVQSQTIAGFPSPTGAVGLSSPRNPREGFFASMASSGPIGGSYIDVDDAMDTD